MGDSKKKIVVVGIIILFIGTLVGISIFRQNISKQGEELPRGEMAAGGPGDTQAVIVNGTTSAGMKEVFFELEELDVELVIETVYLSNGDEVEAGSKILKITEDSLENARKSLEREQNQTTLAYEQSILENQTAMNDAKKIYEVSLIEAEYAKEQYESSLKQAQEELENLEEALEEAKVQYQEYEVGIYQNGYYEEYEVAKKKELYETNEALYFSTLKKWNIDDTEVNNEDSINTKPGLMQDSDRQQRVMILEQMEDAYRAMKEEYKLAEEECANAVKQAQAGMKEAQATCELARLSLEQGKINYEKKVSASLADYEILVAKGNTAKSTYDTQIKKLEEEQHALLSKKEAAKKNLQVFEASIGDGFLYTGNRGEIMLVAVSAHNNLEPDSLVLAYTNLDIMTVNISVDQTDIGELALGDKANVTIAEKTYDGTVTKINPVTISNSKATVSYSVEITLEGDTTEISTNQIATVRIGESSLQEEPPKRQEDEGENPL